MSATCDCCWPSDDVTWIPYGNHLWVKMHDFEAAEAQSTQDRQRAEASSERERKLREALLTGCPRDCEDPEHDDESEDHTGYVCMVCANYVDSVGDPRHGADCIVLETALAAGSTASHGGAATTGDADGTR